MPEYRLTVRPGHPDFLDLPWETPLVAWETPRLVDLPKGISRHPVRFLAYDEGLYVVKELPLRAARRDYSVLQALEGVDHLAVTAVGLVEHRQSDPTDEASAALITAYLQHAFSFRELVEGPGFGVRRNQMLDAFAGLLVELHIAGVFWGDCSLSNVLYRFDAEAVDTIMVDAETAFIVETLSDGQREEDLQIMIDNVAGGMADIAAQQGVALDHADLDLGTDIAERYRSLWLELIHVDVINPSERHKIHARVRRLNELGFDVKSVDLRPTRSGDRLELSVRPGGRHFHARRLRTLTGLHVSEWQARQLLSDLYYFQGPSPRETVEVHSSPMAGIEWRARVFDPMIEHLRGLEGITEPIQAYCDILHHRYVKSREAGHDIGSEAALNDWLTCGRPGYRLSDPT